VFFLSSLESSLHMECCELGSKYKLIDGGDICQNSNGNMSVLRSIESFLHMKCCKPESKCESLNGDICQILIRTRVFLKFLKKFLTYEMFITFITFITFYHLHIFSPIATLQWQGLSMQQATRLSSTHFCDHNILGVTVITIA